MRQKLIHMTLEDRIAAKRFWNDPDGDKVEDDRCNRHVREAVCNLTMALRVAIMHPRDEDCRALMEMVDRVLEYRAKRHPRGWPGQR